jgi:NADPH:quinone reductase-like Zn-dependent oxidoreductase
MRAVAVRQFRAPPELMELPVPSMEAGELLVRVEFAGVNPFDWKIADGALEGHRPHVFPLVLGVDAAGTVEAAGPLVGKYRVGDRLVGQFLHDPVGIGTYAEYATVPEGIGIVRVPEALPLAEAAAGMTALAGLETLGLARGDSLVIMGASGGVGSFATEMASVRGTRVIAVARASSAARLRALGAEEVVDPASDVVAAVKQARPEGADGLLDAMSDRAGIERIAAAVRRGGTVLSTTFSADVAVLERSGVHAVNLNMVPNAALMERLVREVLSHHLKIPLERRVSLEEAPAALAELRAGRGHGKTVVEPHR